MKVKTLRICRYGRTQYNKGFIFEVPDGIAADMVLHGDAKLINDSARELVRKHKNEDGKHKLVKEPKPAKPIRVKKNK